MARKNKLVTRTMTTTICTVQCAERATGLIEEHEVKLPSTYKNDDALMKAIKEQIETDDIKPVFVVEKHEETTLYGMEESVFLEHAKVLPPRANKEQ